LELYVCASISYEEDHVPYPCFLIYGTYHAHIMDI
jgi:hypothetical protein